MPAADSSSRILRAIERFGLRIRAVEEVPESHSSVVRVLHVRDGDRVVIKLPWSALKLRREMSALTALASEPLAPDLLDSFTDDDDVGALLMSFRPGVPVGSVAHCDADLAGEIGLSLARLHSARLPTTEPEIAALGWWGFLNANLTRCLDLCRAHEPHDDWDRAENVVQRATAGLPPVAPLHLTHCDFRLGNLLHVDGRLTGLVDFESARNGSGGMDYPKLAREAWDPRPDLRDAMLRAYETVRPLPEPVETARPLYDVYHAIAGLGWCLRRGNRDAAFYEFNRSTLGPALGQLEVSLRNR